MIVTTGIDVSGREVSEYLGVVRGIVVRATGIGRGFIGGLKSIAGGNIEEFTVVCEEARMEAFNRMVTRSTPTQSLECGMTLRNLAKVERRKSWRMGPP
jgi:uncharacterized protein YbjQ (UPF0145 family)